MATIELLNPTTAHRDVVLENIAIKYTNEEFVGERLFSKIPVAMKHDDYYVWGFEAFRPMDDTIQSSGEAPEIEGPKVAEDGYRCRGKALATAVPDDVRFGRDASLGDPDVEAVENLLNKFWMARELRIVNLVRDPDVYDSDLVVDMGTQLSKPEFSSFGTGGSSRGAGDMQWNNYSSGIGSTSTVLANTYQSDPIGAINYMKDVMHKKIIKDPRTLVIPRHVYRALERHPAILHVIQFVERSISSRSLIASLLDVDEIITPSCLYDKAVHDHDAELEYMWGKDVLLAYVPPSPSNTEPAFAYEFVYNMTGEYEITRWREAHRKRDMIRIDRWSDLKIIAKDKPTTSGKSIAGFLLRNVVA